MTSKKSLWLTGIALIASLLFASAAYAAPQSKQPAFKESEPIVYGGASFLEDPSTFQLKQKVQLAESNGYVYLSWVNSRYQEADFYVSVAKDGKWLIRGKKVFSAAGDDLTGNPQWELKEIANLGNVVYLSYINRENMKYEIRQVNLNAKGDIAVNKSIFTMPMTGKKHAPSSGVIRPLYTSKGPGVIFHKEYEEEPVYPFKVKEATYTLYLASTQAKAVSFVDKDFALYNALPPSEKERSTKTAPNAYWDVDNNLLYHMTIGGASIWKFNTKTGKAVLNAKKEQLSLLTWAAFVIDPQYSFAYNSSTGRHWMEKFDNKTMKTSAVSEYFELENRLYNENVFVTSTAKEIRLWEISDRVDRELRPALKLIRFTK